MKKKILLVEDDLFLRDIYLEMLRTDTLLDIDFAEDGQKAYEKIKIGGWDLVMLDVFMPALNGVAVLQKFTPDEINKLTKHIVLMTNSDDTKDFQEVIPLVEAVWLKSSFTPDELLLRVKAQIS